MPSRCCEWYWDGSRWNGPVNHGCATCQGTQPSFPPPAAGTICVPCPGGAMEKGEGGNCIELTVPSDCYLFVSGRISFVPHHTQKSQKQKKQIVAKKRARKAPRK